MSYTRDEFTKKYSSFIAKAVKGTGILVGTVLAQAILESQGKEGSVYKVGASKLAKEANNYFGIKCHGWSGEKYNIDTTEYTPSGQKYVSKSSCFRAYSNVEDSIKDYVKFLKENERYERAGVFKATTVRKQAEALKEHISENVAEVTKFQVNFAKKYWWVILLGTAGVVGIVYATVKLKK